MGLIEWRGHTVSLLRRKELETVADFSPDYLHALQVAAPISRRTNAPPINRQFFRGKSRIG